MSERRLNITENVDLNFRGYTTDERVPVWECPDCAALVLADPVKVERHKEWCGRVVRNMGAKRY